MRLALFYMLLGTVIRCGRIRTYADRRIVRQAGGGACAAVSFSGGLAIRAGHEQGRVGRFRRIGQLWSNRLE